jgi:hypothetical protein
MLKIEVSGRVLLEPTPPLSKPNLTGMSIYPVDVFTIDENAGKFFSR